MGYQQMRVSENQIWWLLEIAKDTLSIAGTFGGISSDDRLKLVNDIIGQQDRRIVEIGSLDPKEEVPEDGEELFR